MQLYSTVIGSTLTFKQRFGEKKTIRPAVSIIETGAVLIFMSFPAVSHLMTLKLGFY